MLLITKNELEIEQSKNAFDIQLSHIHTYIQDTNCFSTHIRKLRPNSEEKRKKIYKTIFRQKPECITGDFFGNIHLYAAGCIEVI